MGFLQKLEQLLKTKPVVLQFLRFAAIGAINTALDFIILNLVTKTLGIESGLWLGVLNVISFSAAIIQSYIWNKVWTFSNSSDGLLKNFFRLVLVGGLGFATFLLVLLGSAYALVGGYYLLVLVVFLLTEIILWQIFRFNFSASHTTSDTKLFTEFLLVSLIGLIINSSIVALGSYVLIPILQDHINTDLIKNLAKAGATAVSLIWNFIGYKLIVFKR